jgi:hypothetical protein
MNPRIILHRGNARVVAEVPTSGIQRERAVEDLKNFVTRPNVLLRQHAAKG